MSEELVDLVDEADRVIGRTTRREMRAGNLLHRNVAILCFDSRGQIYVQQRTLEKDLFPGLYDMFVGGVVGAGEGYAEAATREIAEELGIRGPTPEYLFTHLYRGPETCSHTAAFRVTWDGPITHQPSEVAWGRHCSIQEIVDNPAGWRFVPDNAEVFERYLRDVHKQEP